MLEKIKNYQYTLPGLIRAFQDVRAIGLMAFLVVALLITWSGVKVIESNYNLQRSISKLQQENEIQKLANKNLELQNEFYNTEEYVDLEARKNFGRAAPGETVVVVPKAVALSYVSGADLQISDKSKTEKQKSNFAAWMDFLMHKEE